MLIFLFGIVYAVLGLGFMIFGIPFIPSEKKVVQKMIELGKLKNTDHVVEIGCGDGRLVFLAAEKAKKVVGYEGVFIVSWWAKWKKFIGRKKGEIRCKNFLKQDLSSYDVVFAYLSDPIMENFYHKKWAELKPGVRVISNSFRLPQDKEQPIKTVRVGKYKIHVYEKS